MTIQSKIVFLVLCLFFISNGLKAHSLNNETSVLTLIQIDSLIHEKSFNYDMDQLDLLVLYHDALNEKHPDSINLFKRVAILNAELEQPRDAYVFTRKYIENTLDFSILNNGAYQSIENTEEYNILKGDYLQNVNLLAFLYFYTALIGFFFVIIINFYKKANKYAKMFIAGFVGIHSLLILEFVLYMTNYQYQFPHTYRISAAGALLFAPLLYFYFKSVTQDYKFKIVHLLHLLPTIILLVFLRPLYSLSALDKLKMMFEASGDAETYDLVIFISKVISLSVYTIFIGRLLLNQNKENSSKSVAQHRVKWEKNIYKIHISYVVSYFLYGISLFGVLGNISSFVYHLQIGAMSAIVLYIAYMSYVQPSIFKNEFISLNKRLFSEKYKKSGLTNALSLELKENLIKLLIDEKLYKENDINLDILAQRLNTTRHNASQIINEHFQMNFFELINKFRIKEAIKILQEDVHGSLNVIDIAYEVGYNNKVTFNKSFKKETSLTPSEFISSKDRKQAQVNLR